MNIFTRKFQHRMANIALVSCLSAPTIAYSEIIDFHFTGNLMVTFLNSVHENTDEHGNLVPLTPVSASLRYDTDLGFGGSKMSINLSNGITGLPTTFHDIIMQHEPGTNIINGSILVDVGSLLINDPAHIAWDATGFLNAIDQGLQVGDTISGSILKKDTTGDGEFDTFIDVFSATPYSDTLLYGYDLEGPAPLAATSETLGLGYDINGNFVGTRLRFFSGLINIGSGNSMTVTSISSVPVPASFWLFGTGLLGLIGYTRKNKK